MKKLIAIFLTLSMMLMLVSCGENSHSTAPGVISTAVTTSSTEVSSTDATTSTTGVTSTTATTSTTTTHDPIKWCAMGDSITEGWCSFYNAAGEAKSQLKPALGWASQLAAMKGYALTNKAVGGSGYLCTRTASSPVLNGKQVADATNFAQFDLVTLAFGVNDWKYNCVLGSMNDDVNAGTSMYSNMRYIIEKILTDNPTCKIIVITPINCMLRGTYETNWGLGYAYSNAGTLENVFNAIVEVCEWYGIEYIDMTHNSIVNKDNISQMLMDKVHPSEECHKLMAQELAKKIVIEEE